MELTVEEAVARIYHILGDNPQRPALFPARDRFVSLLNDGLMAIRRQAAERWKTITIIPQVGVSNYTLPDRTGEWIRAEFSGEFINVCNILQLSAIDPKWVTRTGNQVEAVTGDGQAFNSLRLYPIPEFNGTQQYDQAPGLDGQLRSEGTVVNVDGFDESSSAGTGTQADGMDMTSSLGVQTSITSPPDQNVRLWAIEIPSPLDTGAMPTSFPLTAIYHALWRVFEDDSEYKNGILSAWYRDLFMEHAKLAADICGDQSPRQVRRGAQNKASAVAGSNLRWPNQVTIGGVPIDVTFPR